MKKSSPRPATEDDLDQVARIEAASIRPPWSREAFSAELEKRFSHFWVLTDDETDSIVYAYVVFALPAEQAHVQTIAVLPESRRQGYARHLLRAVISFVMRQEGESVILEARESNLAAIRLYQSLGFVIIRRTERFYPDGESALTLLYSTKQKENLSADGYSADRSPKNFN